MLRKDTLISGSFSVYNKGNPAHQRPSADLLPSIEHTFFRPGSSKRQPPTLSRETNMEVTKAAIHRLPPEAGSKRESLP